MSKKNSKKILVTGGSGFIGSNFIRHLYKKYLNYQIYNYDLLTYAGNKNNLKDIEEEEKSKKQKRYFFIHGDICDAKKLEALLKKEHFDVVINFAAESHVDRSLVDAAEFIRTNITGVHVLVNLLMKQAVPRFIQISTDEIYGDIETG